MDEREVAWPTGMSDQDPAARDRPLVFNPKASSSRSWRTTTQRVAGALTDDPDTIKLYVGSARQGRSALWVHVPEEADAKRAVRALADHQVLHIRHYGQDRQDDIHIA
jgi:hypothetical protein